jgi:hypothetical protein
MTIATKRLAARCRSRMCQAAQRCRRFAFSRALPAVLLLLGPTWGRAAGIAYGTVNNFDTVNDTGVQCHGFEIELDDIRSTDITYTYDYNHYGTPGITEDSYSVPGHTNVLVRYQAVWTNTGWSAYTAIPAGPIPATAGHQFTNPGTNFGGNRARCCISGWSTTAATR